MLGARNRGWPPALPRINTRDSPVWGRQSPIAMSLRAVLPLSMRSTSYGDVAGQRKARVRRERAPAHSPPVEQIHVGPFDEKASHGAFGGIQRRLQYTAGDLSLEGALRELPSQCLAASVGGARLVQTVFDSDCRCNTNAMRRRYT